MLRVVRVQPAELHRLAVDMVMASVLSYAAEVSTVLAFLVVLSGACAAARKRAWGRHVAGHLDDGRSSARSARS